MKHIVAINGSYRDDGTIDQVLAAVAQAARQAGAEVEEIRLRDTPIEFCLNCRECTQQAGIDPGLCVQDDAMAEIICKLEGADGYILASPTNVGSVTALFKRFMERLAVYVYWPWGAPAPKKRKQGVDAKPALLIASGAAPSLLGRLFFSTLKQLKMTAENIGAKPRGSLFIGLAAGAPHQRLDPATRAKAERLGKRLVSP